MISYIMFGILLSIYRYQNVLVETEVKKKNWDLIQEGCGYPNRNKALFVCIKCLTNEMAIA